MIGSRQSVKLVAGDSSVSSIVSGSTAGKESDDEDDDGDDDLPRADEQNWILDSRQGQRPRDFDD